MTHNGAMKPAVVHARVEMAVPNRRTASTLAKSRRGEDVREFKSLDEMFKTWEK